MAVVNYVEKKIKINHTAAIKFQIITHCFLSGIVLSESEIDCLTLLAISGEQDLNSFCQKASTNSNIFKSAQTVRNTIGKAEKYNLVLKEGKSKKKIYINPALKVQTKGNIYLDFKFLAVETAES